MVPIAELRWYILSYPKLFTPDPNLTWMFKDMSASTSCTLFAQRPFQISPESQYLVHFPCQEPVLAECPFLRVIIVISGKLLLSRFVWSICKNSQRFRFGLSSSFRSLGDSGGGDDDGSDLKKGKGKIDRGGSGHKKRQHQSETLAC